MVRMRAATDVGAAAYVSSRRPLFSCCANTRALTRAPPSRSPSSHLDWITVTPVCSVSSSGTQT
eukprot:16433245-Heterocapsa_arctica.AAC.1